MPTLKLDPLPSDLTGTAPANDAAPPSPVTVLVTKLIEAKAPLDQLTQVYMQLRDKKSDLDTTAKLKVRPLIDGMASIEAHLLERFTEMGVDNVKTAHGTPYISTKTSVTMADAVAFWQFTLAKALEALPLADAMKAKLIDSMVASGALSFLEARPAKTVCEQYATDHNEFPPGVNTRVERCINVRAK